MFRGIFNKYTQKRLLIALALVAVAIIAERFAIGRSNIKKHMAHVNSVVIEKSKLIDQQLLKLSQIPDQELFSSYSDKGGCEQGIEYLVYKNDTLIYWSGNESTAGFIYDSAIFNRNFVELGNGYYYRKALVVYEKVFIGLLLIRKNYKYENDYVTNEYNQCLSLPRNTEISFLKNGNDINNENGEYIFSLIFSDERISSEHFTYLLLIIYLIALLFIISALFHMYEVIRERYQNANWVFLFFIIDVLIIRAALFYFKIPDVLYGSKLFGPFYLATSVLLPSLGDVVVNAIIILLLMYYFFRHFDFNLKEKGSSAWKKVAAFTMIFHVFVFFELFQILFERIVIDSTISFDLGNIFNLNLISVLGFFAIGVMLVAYFFLTAKLCLSALTIIHEKRQYFLLVLITTLVIVAINLVRDSFSLTSVIFVFLLTFSFAFWTANDNKWFDTGKIIFYLICFTVITTYQLQSLNEYREKQERKLIAIELASDRDKMAEYRFQQSEKEILKDTTLLNLVNQAYINPDRENMVRSYILSKYFNNSWAKYDIQVTICFPGKELHIKPGDYIIDCNAYFQNYIGAFGEKTDSENLYYIFPGINYFVHLQFPDQLQRTENSVYIEISAKAITKGLGYPELLVDKSSPKPTDIYNYSYAIFMDGELIRSVGKYTYSNRETEITDNKGNFTFFKRNNYNHLVYLASNSTCILVSLPQPSFLDLLAAYSYFFIFLGLISLILYTIIRIRDGIGIQFISFKYRIQFLMFGILLFSFIVIGFSTLFYITKLNDNKNISILSEKNHSVLVELEHKLSSHNELNTDIAGYLNDLLMKFSLVFFSDINLYDPQGRLLSSSRPQVFEEGLLSDRMNAEAYRQLAIQQKSSFIQRESIGSYNYLSSYLPFRNDQNKLVGYVNLPYFARQSELRQEISTFLVTFTNIYVVLMAIGLFFALLLSGYLLRPLMLLKANLQRLKLSESTLKIEWKGKDEISELIGEYNRMTEELVKSAELLARSERESAWREMARQVAHEIKNPLTPMKLSVQYLQKAWNDNAPDWNERLNRFAQTLIQQIDSLSEIASAFSDFATMPVAAKVGVSLVEIIQDAVSLYKDTQNIRFDLSGVNKESFDYVFADKRQLLRVFNNLIHNSVQAIGNKPQGQIQIKMVRENNFWIVEIQDNGSGMNQEQQAKVFSPYFTTKSSGMGLGLAIVRNIVSGMGGNIEFTSEEHKGTTFTLRFPIFKEGSK